MKIDFVKTIIAVAIGCLIAYGLYTVCEYDNLRWLLTSIGGGILSLLLVFSIGLFFICGVVNFGFAFFNFSKPLFIIVNGIILLIYALIVQGMYKNQQ